MVKQILKEDFGLEQWIILREKLKMDHYIV